MMVNVVNRLAEHGILYITKKQCRFGASPLELTRGAADRHRTPSTRKTFKGHLSHQKDSDLSYQSRRAGTVPYTKPGIFWVHNHQTCSVDLKESGKSDTTSDCSVLACSEISLIQYIPTKINSYKFMNVRRIKSWCCFWGWCPPRKSVKYNHNPPLLPCHQFKPFFVRFRICVVGLWFRTDPQQLFPQKSQTWISRRGKIIGWWFQPI